MTEEVTAVDLPGAERRQPRATDLLLELGLSARAELVVSQSSYTWFLMSQLERRARSFDPTFTGDGKRTFSSP